MQFTIWTYHYHFAINSTIYSPKKIKLSNFYLCHTNKQANTFQNILKSNKKEHKQKYSRKETITILLQTTLTPPNKFYTTLTLQGVPDF